MSTDPRVLLSSDEAQAFADAKRREGLRIVFTAGVFDLLHPGHLRLLQAARHAGDVLIVGVRSDDVVRAIKGPERPIIPEAERAELVAALACVDAVIVFGEGTPGRLVRALRPDVLALRAGVPHDASAGQGEVEAWGGRVVRVRIETNHSTTEIVERAKALPARP
jgi:D-beta-D-heptose 7-phosphate kinase/D-beta-D-heptose 1-phosphate adenosyltransferase